MNSLFPANIYLSKVNYRNTRKSVTSELIKKPEQRFRHIWRYSTPFPNASIIIDF